MNTTNFRFCGVRMRTILPLLLFALAAVSSSQRAEAAEQGTVALPRQRVATDVVSPGKVIQVDAGGNFQAALERATPGDTIELEAGAVFRGSFILPRKPAALFLRALNQGASDEDDTWITIRSGRGSVALPPQGVRVSPSDAPAMARLEAVSGAVVTTAPGAHHYRFVGIEFSPAEMPPRADGGVVLNGLVLLDAKGATPHHLIIERCYLHGDPRMGARRGIVMNSAMTAVVDSYLSDFKVIGEDSQAIIGWSGPGPYLIQNNYLEAAGENLMFGGADPAVRDRVPADIEIRGNHFARPTAWRAGTHWTIKNLFELKNARRVLVDGNLFEYHWAQAQNGFAILFTVRNQDGSAPWSVVEDVTFSNNIVRHVARGINILGQDDNYPSRQTRNIHIRNNLFADVGGDWGDGDLLQLLDGTANVVVEHNTALNTGKVLIGDGRPNQGFVFRDNIVRHNQYGIVGSDSAPGNPALESYFPGAVMRDNLIIGGHGHNYPAGNAFPSSIKAVRFSDPAAGDFRVQAAMGGSVGVDFTELCTALSATERPSYCVDGAQARR